MRKRKPAAGFRAVEEGRDKGEKKEGGKKEINCGPLNDLVPLQAIMTQGGWQNYS